VQNSLLQDLQNELKSLKALIKSRVGQRPYTPTPIVPSTSSPGLTVPGNAPAVPAEPISATILSGGETPPIVSHGTQYLAGRSGIPAWQLAAREKSQQNTKVEDESVQSP
jgi:hypothetical protein